MPGTKWSHLAAPTVTKFCKQWHYIALSEQIKQTANFEITFLVKGCQKIKLVSCWPSMLSNILVSGSIVNQNFSRNLYQKRNAYWNFGQYRKIDGNQTKTDILTKTDNET